MNLSLGRLLVIASLLAVMLLILSPAAHAQGTSGPYYGPYSVYNPNLTGLRPQFVNVPTRTQIAIQTTVTVPDGGQVLLGGYSRVSEGRSEYGAPGLGKVPYLGRGFRNVGYGREMKTGQVVVGVRIINLYEEEERQTGVRSNR
jgi:Flp pilus assembly secretin CpaC